MCALGKMHLAVRVCAHENTRACTHTRTHTQEGTQLHTQTRGPASEGQPPAGFSLNPSLPQSPQLRIWVHDTSPHQTGYEDAKYFNNRKR